MSAKFIFVFTKYTAKIFILSISFLMLFCNSANAVLINFDDLDPNAYSDIGGNPYLTNEYESQGLIISGAAYLIEWSQWSTPASLPNYLVGPGFGLDFIGDLPSYVSFKVGSSTKSAVFIDVTGPAGYAKNIISSGEIHGMSGEEGTPYIPNEIFSFYSETGIASISFSGQSDAYIDDLFYTYSSSTSVPEPTVLILFFIGLLGLSARRFNMRSKS